MKGTIENRDVFLEKLANQLGRNKIMEKVERPQWKYSPQHSVLKEASQDDLVRLLEEQCIRIHTDFYQTSSADLKKTVRDAVEHFGGGPVIIPHDARFEEYGLRLLIEEEWPFQKTEVYEWNREIGEKNISFAEKANIGITFSEITLAESGTVVLFSSPDKGRSVSLLPAVHILIIPKSTLVPRMTQAAQKIAEKVKTGEVLPSCINYITGPSNSADIEMDLVVGVHGPVKAAYIVVEDK